MKQHPGQCGLLGIGFLALLSGAAVAEVRYPAGKAMTLGLPGMPAAMKYNGEVLWGIDPLFGTEDFVIPVIVDTGASGNMLSNLHSSVLGVPLTGETFDDVGIGGIETFNVSGPLELGIASADYWLTANPEVFDFYGPIKVQVRQEDPQDGMGVYNVFGMPTIEQGIFYVRGAQIIDTDLWTGIQYV